MGIVILNILFTFLVTSCGDIQIPDQNQQKEESPETRDNGDKNTPNLGSNTHVQVAVEVDVDVTTLPVDAPQFVYNTVQKTWDDAVKHTPQGYKLMTRAEILVALEAGNLDAVLHQDAVIWTGTPYGDGEMVYFYSHQDQATTPGLKMLRFGSLYKKQEITHQITQGETN